MLIAVFGNAMSRRQKPGVQKDAEEMLIYFCISAEEQQHLVGNKMNVRAKPSHVTALQQKTIFNDTNWRNALQCFWKEAWLEC